MADNIEVEVNGLAELSAGTVELAGRIEGTSEERFQGVADQVASGLRGRLPHRTGRLAGSVSSGGAVGGAEVGMGDGVPYAQYVEYGGRGFPHSSTGNYLYPSAVEAEPLLAEAATKAANDEIGAMSWPTPS